VRTRGERRFRRDAAHILRDIGAGRSADADDQDALPAKRLARSVQRGVRDFAGETAQAGNRGVVGKVRHGELTGAHCDGVETFCVNVFLDRFRTGVRFNNATLFRVFAL
jgi:hypothetical protein